MSRHFYPFQEKKGFIFVPRGTMKLSFDMLASGHCCYIENFDNTEKKYLYKMPITTY